MNDRSLRKIVVEHGRHRYVGIPARRDFDITVASEAMAILCLSNSIKDLKQRLGNIFVGYTMDQQPVYAPGSQSPGSHGGLAEDALQPNLVQTLEGYPAIIHGGPFANIAQGTNTVIATKTGLSLADWVVTEAGFGSDLGAENLWTSNAKTQGWHQK